MSSFPLRAALKLGLSRNCTREDARKQYMKLSLIYHPDKSGTNSGEKFAEINNAYLEMMQWFEAGGRGGEGAEKEEQPQDAPQPQGGRDYAKDRRKRKGFEKDANGESAWKSASDDAFDPGKQSKKPRMRSEDSLVEIPVSFENLYTGFVHEYVHPTSGKIFVKIEPGSVPERRIVYEGLSLNNRVDRDQGDLIFVLKLRKKSNFIRDGANIWTIIPITLADALSRKDIFLEMPDGRSINVCSGKLITPDKSIRIENEGIPRGSGTLTVRFDVIFPEKKIDQSIIDAIRSFE